jgi:hypothetical protein
MFELRLDPNASTSVEILRSKKESEVSMFLPFSERLKVRIANVTPYAANNSVDRCGSDVLFQCELCQHGTPVHKVHVNCISHVTLRHLLTHLGCVYNRSL